MKEHHLDVAVTRSAKADRAADAPKRIRVLVVDNDLLESELLKSALAYHFEITCCDMAVDHVNIAAGTFNPNIVLVKYQLKQDGSTAGLIELRKIVNIVHSSRVIVLFDSSDPNGVIESFHAGAKGVFRRSHSLQQLARCIEAVDQGQVWASSADLDLVVQAFATTMPLQFVNGNGKNLLSPREQQVVELIAEGLNNHEISEQLQISQHTVKNYLCRVYEKLGISTRVELILYAVSKRAAA